MQPIQQRLLDHHKNLQQHRLIELFDADPKRAQRYRIEAAGLCLDYAKNHITPAILDNLVDWAEQQQLTSATEAMFQGDIINTTEHRAVLHTALRSNETEPLLVDGTDIRPLIQAQKQKMRQFVNALHQGQILGHSGKPIRHVVNIGIGGSDLGPKMVTFALEPYHHTSIQCHFVSNVDASDLVSTLKHCQADETLFIVASKTFTTQETLMNANSAREWLLSQAPESATQQHFLAITSARDKAIEFGIAADNIFDMWDWVGGRYSLWSTIGLPIACAVGMEHFEALLAGAFEMDQHFRYAPLHQNMPVIMALIGAWYGQYYGCQSQVILPYDHYLQHLPSYLQQLDMESNGKSVQIDGTAVTQQTGPVIWGSVGTNGQHAFHQLLHQGTILIPADFIIARQSHHDYPQHHAALYAHCLAQSQALMVGKTEQQAYQELKQQGHPDDAAQRLAPHKVIPGNKPSNVITMDKLTPKTLGTLIALYEHKVFAQSLLWQINAFDQWGVELGKQLSGPILNALTSQQPLDIDSATQQLIYNYGATKP